MHSGKWDLIWLGWLFFMPVVDYIADRLHQQATFSEHSRKWFHSWAGRISLAAFMIALYFHLTPPYLSVKPVAITGAIISYFVGRWYLMRWDKWLGGLVVAAITGALQSPVALSLFADGKLTTSELFIFVAIALGAGAAWMKDHKPPVEDTTVIDLTGQKQG